MSTHFYPRKHWLLLAVCLLALSLRLYAQGPPQRRGQPPPDFAPPIEQGRPGGPGLGQGPPPGVGFLSSEMLSDGKVVKGAPFAATVVTEMTQTLGDGTKITRKLAAAFFRDSEGCTRREHKVDSVGPFAVVGEAPQLVFIHDAVTDARYVLNLQLRLARKLVLPSGGPPPLPGPPPGEAKTEALGKQMIEGLEAEGTRTTVTIPAGQIGNDRPLAIVTERWESTALQVVVLSKHSDPRVGENVYRLTNIERSEPARSLFEVPADFKLSEGEPLGPPARRGGRPFDD